MTEPTFNKFQSFLKRHWLLFSASTITSALAWLAIGLGLGFATGLPFFGLGAAITAPIFAGIGFILGLVVAVSGALFQDQYNKQSGIPVSEKTTNLLLNSVKPAPQNLSSMGTTNQFFKKLKFDLDLHKFLTSVAQGEQNDAEKLLRGNLKLMTDQCDVKDYSKRTFPLVSGFVYALAALDTRYMTGMMLKCLRENKTLAIEEKRSLVKELQRQYDEFELTGVTYLLDGQTYEKQKDFGIKPLIKALQEYESNCDQWSAEEQSKHFCTEIGGAQRQVPAHVAQHYCEPGVSFDSKPSFTEETFNRCSKFYNYVNRCSNQDWWADGEGVVLGLNFGILRAGRVGDAAAMPKGRDPATKVDRLALENLLKIRTKDKGAIPGQLESLLQELNQIEDSVQPSFQKT